MSKIAYIYPGQGSQKAGMGADFYENSPIARDIYDKASEALGLDMKALCFKENEKLDLTEYTQAALVTTCLAITETLKDVAKGGLTPTVTAGLSLGEYCAIAAAGGMDVMDAIRLVRKRGILMQNTVPAGEGAMAAILGMAGEAIEQVMEDMPGVTIANYNCPGQIVITGEARAVEEACDALKAAGAKRAVALNVSGPFHSPMLKDAGSRLAAELKKVELHELTVPYVTNVTAKKVADIAQTKALLAEQVSMPVRWQQSVETMIADGVDTFIEIGPGRTLAGFMKKINRAVTVYNIAEWADMETVISACRLI
ncbi:malonyl CoA-acyl carrier protein transacylase [Lachnospiraceae bacterium]|uniref:ACP S-malonyltransferase n=1 Tax=Extibacter sp. GGCC_0201 TaxID=2731209 RepID=UPI001AA0C17E|nr:ACP S-malonyltransferase [Extibacter sp. GGCC_0201]MBO1722005.1 ACP S-malonyltransferase [Extibacter sp. GGCC_0201]BDF35165.1 malonyl CoA-acyl carrier protein transacylase [Lachnospiraceae bacterium]BDF39166.1 malonyl CoA-acyl carrier protein transacylase [Lachnospiraceae bacterium]